MRSRFLSRESAVAIALGILCGAILSLLLMSVVWPLITAAGAGDLNQPLIRLAYTLLGAVPALAGGYVAGRRAPFSPALHGLIVGCVLLFPLLWRLPAVLQVYADNPQSYGPLLLAWALRPLGGLAGGQLATTQTHRGDLSA